MLLYSTVLKSFFWIAMGMIYIMVIVGAPVWAKDLGWMMNWWKWLLVAAWYCLLSIGIAGGFTLIGEKEGRAGYYFLGFSLVIMVILGFGLLLLL